MDARTLHISTHREVMTIMAGYSERAVSCGVAMLAELRSLPPEDRMDALVIVCKMFVETHPFPVTANGPFEETEAWWHD